MTLQPSVAPMTLTTVVASTRPGRVGRSVADWFTHRAAEHDQFESHTVDLHELALPFYDEPHPPALRQYTKSHTREWSRIVDASDAFVFVTPEYNHSFPAALKNALDFLHVEWADKPAGLVSYGGVSAGLRAATALKPVLAALRMVPVVEAVSVPFVLQFVDGDEFVPNAELEAGGKAMLEELLRLAPALRQARAGE